MRELFGLFELLGIVGSKDHFGTFFRVIREISAVRGLKVIIVIRRLA